MLNEIPPVDPQGPAREYDLKVLAAWVAKAQRFARWAFPILTAVFTIIFGSIAFTRVAAYDYLGPGTLFFFAAAAGFAAFGFFAIRMSGPAPERARIGSNSLEFEYPNGRVLRYVWSDPRLHLRLRAWRDYPIHTVQFPYLHEVLTSGLRPGFPLTDELFDAILQTARGNGARVESKAGSAGFDATRRERIDYTIKGGLKSQT